MLILPNYNDLEQYIRQTVDTNYDILVWRVFVDNKWLETFITWHMC